MDENPFSDARYASVDPRNGRQDRTRPESKNDRETVWENRAHARAHGEGSEIERGV